MKACKQIILHLNKDPWSLPWLTRSPNKCHGATGHGSEEPAAIKPLMVLNNSVGKVGRSSEKMEVFVAVCWR